MKLKILSLIVACMLFTGCTSAPVDTDNNTEKNDNTAITETDPSVADTLFIGYDKQDPSSWDTAASYVVNNKGEKIIPISKDSKNRIEINGKQYALVRTVGNTRLDEYGWYNNDYVYTLYDEEGTKVGEIPNVNYVQYITDGKFYGYNSNKNEYCVYDIFTGEKEDTDILDVLKCNNEPVALLHMDKSYSFKGISDIDGSDLKTLDLYDSAYAITTNYNIFLVAQLKLDETGGNITGEDRYKNRVYHLLDLEGEKIVDMDFDNIYSRDDYIFARSNGTTFVLDAKTGQVLRELPGEVVDIDEDKGVFIKVEENEDAKYGRIYSLMDLDMNVLSTGWEGYSDMYRGATDEYYMFYKYEDPESYYSSIYILNTKGEITFGPMEEKDVWVVAMCENYFLAEEYNSEKGHSVYYVYDYNGNEKQLDKNYVSIQRQYNYDGYKDYFIASYENSVSAGYIYDIIDTDFNVIHTGFNYVYPYATDQGRYVSAGKGFDIGIIDVETGNWIYKEKCFNALDD